MIATIYANVPDSVRLVLAIPGVSGLTSIIVQAWRDQLAHERALELQERQNQFTLGIASEMASLAFRKHVEFAEEYAAAVHTAITELFRDGPTRKAVEYFQTLRDLRKKYTVWLSDEIETKLLPFEEALLEIGTSAQLADLGGGATREHFVQVMFAKLQKVLTTDKEVAVSENEAAVIILKHLCEILSISKLTELRNASIEAAMQQLPDRRAQY